MVMMPSLRLTSFRCCATLMLGFSLTLSAQDSADWKKPSQPVYVVTRNHYAEGFTHQGRTPRFGELIMIEIFNPGGAGRGDASRAGQAVALYSGGQKLGRVVVNRVAPLQCDSSAAVVSAC